MSSLGEGEGEKGSFGTTSSSFIYSWGVGDGDKSCPVPYE